MIQFTARRLLHSVPLLLGVVTLMFFLLQLAPGDPLTAMIGDYPATEEYKRRISEAYGLDKPLLMRYWLYLTQIVQLNLGDSLATRVPVMELILDRLPATLVLTVTAMVLAAIVGILIGLWAGTSRRNLTDRGVTGFAVAAMSVPNFWLGQLLILGFALLLGWLPSQGMVTARTNLTGFASFLDFLSHLILPVIVLAMREIGVIARMVRSSVHETLAMPHIETARAKGVPRSLIIRGHVLRNSLMPAITVIGYNFGFVLAGSVLIETVFGWPGMGQLLYDSIRSRDSQVTMGIVLLIAVVVIIVNLITDIVYAVVDPRIRLGGKRVSR